jgi:hypothetical protein
MPKIFAALAALALVVPALGGCSVMNAVGLGESIELTPQTAAAYDNYLAQLGPDNHGYFAVSADGAGYGFTLCGAEPCEEAAQKTALDGCKAGSNGQECQIFAIDRDSQMGHSVKGE